MSAKNLPHSVISEPFIMTRSIYVQRNRSRFGLLNLSGLTYNIIILLVLGYVIRKCKWSLDYWIEFNLLVLLTHSLWTIDHKSVYRYKNIRQVVENGPHQAHSQPQILFSSIKRAYEWNSLPELSIVKAGDPQGSIFSYTDKWSSVNPKFISPFQRSISGFSVCWWHKSHLPWIGLLSTRPLTMSRSFYWTCFILFAIQEKHKWCNFNHRYISIFLHYI